MHLVTNQRSKEKFQGATFVSAYQSCSNCGGALDAALNKCPICGTERLEGRLARRKRRSAVRVATWLVAVTTFAVFLIGVVGGFLYRSNDGWGGASSGSLQLQPLPLPAIRGAQDDRWAAVLRVQPKEAGGSREGIGFFIDREGHLVTAAHVVEGGQCVTLTDRNGRSYEGTVLGMDRLLDIALIRLATPGAPRAYLPLVEQGAPAVGTKVAVAHLVTGNDPVEQRGEIHQVGLAMSIDGRYLQNLTEIKGVGAVPGMSGGPILDVQSGRAVGVLVAGAEAGTGYAIPFQQSTQRLREWRALPTPAGCAQSVASTQTDLQLATITPLSGLLGVWGADLADGASLALLEMEAELQRVGFRVTLRRLDDAGNPATAKEQAALVAADPQVIGVVGSLTNPLSDAVYAGLAWSQKALIIPATPAEQPFAGKGSPPFRLVPSVQEQMVRLLESLRQQRRIERIVLLDDGTALGKARTQLFARLAEAQGMAVVDRISLGPEMIPEQTYQRVSKENPDLIYYGASAGTLRSVLALLEGRPWLLAGGAELAETGFESLPHAVTEGMLLPYVVTGPPAPFASHFASVMGKPTARFSHYGYDSAMLILEALVDWGAGHPGQVPDGETLRRLIAQRGRYQGVSGRIGFGPDGENREATILIYRWSGGALRLVSKG